MFRGQLKHLKLQNALQSTKTVLDRCVKNCIFYWTLILHWKLLQIALCGYFLFFVVRSTVAVLMLQIATTFKEKLILYKVFLKIIG